MVNIKLERWAAAWRHATAVLKEQPKHTKCLYRAGIANAQLERYTDAVACFQAASEQVKHSYTGHHLAAATDLTAVNACLAYTLYQLSSLR